MAMIVKLSVSLFLMWSLLLLLTTSTKVVDTQIDSFDRNTTYSPSPVVVLTNSADDKEEELSPDNSKAIVLYSPNPDLTTHCPKETIENVLFSTEGFWNLTNHTISEPSVETISDGFEKNSLDVGVGKYSTFKMILSDESLKNLTSLLELYDFSYEFCMTACEGMVDDNCQEICAIYVITKQLSTQSKYVAYVEAFLSFILPTNTSNFNSELFDFVVYKVLPREDTKLIVVVNWFYQFASWLFVYVLWVLSIISQVIAYIIWFMGQYFGAYVSRYVDRWGHYLLDLMLTICVRILDFVMDVVLTMIMVTAHHFGSNIMNAFKLCFKVVQLFRNSIKTFLIAIAERI